jgi:SAM-dependent methyltransferase
MGDAGAGDHACPLCRAGGDLFHADLRDGDYFRCRRCGLVWLDPGRHLSPENERAHYATHRNSPADPGYRRFLNQLWGPLRERLAPGASGLDYGSGPGPTLHLMAREDGFSCTHYDPFFTPAASRLERDYDFITCSETAEHFHRPGREFIRLRGLLRPGGWLGVMTLSLPDPTEFPRWHYRADPTHVVFYSPRVFGWIQAALDFGRVEFPHPRVALLRAGPPLA